jgi:hypothetical protein
MRASSPSSCHEDVHFALVNVSVVVEDAACVLVPAEESLEQHQNELGAAGPVEAANTLQKMHQGVGKMTADLVYSAGLRWVDAADHDSVHYAIRAVRHYAQQLLGSLLQGNGAQSRMN